MAPKQKPRMVLLKTDAFGESFMMLVLVGAVATHSVHPSMPRAHCVLLPAWGCEQMGFVQGCRKTQSPRVLPT